MHAANQPVAWNRTARLHRWLGGVLNCSPTATPKILAASDVLAAPLLEIPPVSLRCSRLRAPLSLRFSGARYGAQLRTPPNTRRWTVESPLSVRARVLQQDYPIVCWPT